MQRPTDKQVNQPDASSWQHDVTSPWRRPRRPHARRFHGNWPMGDAGEERRERSGCGCRQLWRQWPCRNKRRTRDGLTSFTIRIATAAAAAVAYSRIKRNWLRLTLPSIAYSYNDAHLPLWVATMHGSSGWSRRTIRQVHVNPFFC